MAKQTPAGKDTLAFNKAHYGELIRDARVRIGLSQRQLADRLGVHKNYIAHWEAGRARPDLNLVPGLCVALDVSLADFFGCSETAAGLSNEEQGLIRDYRRLTSRDRTLVLSAVEKMLELSASELRERCRTAFIPILHNCQTAAAGTGVMLEAATEQYRTFIRHGGAADRADEIVTVNGDSMEPEFHHGQDVLIEYTGELHPGEIGLFVVNGDGYIKEWAKDRLHSLNPAYPDIQLHESDDFRCVGRVTGVVDAGDYPTEEEEKVLQELLRENAFER